MQVMLSVGIVVGSVIVGRMRNIGTMRTVAQGLAITGVLSVGIALSPWLWLVAIFLLLASSGNPIYSVGNVTALMDASDSSNRGTIMSSRFAITQLALIVGAATGGFVSQYIGPEATYGVLGAGLLALALVAELLPRERPVVVPATE
jgi:predicted MFS family arabinose efflux permease